VNRHVFEGTAVACGATLLVALASLLFGGMIRVAGSSLVVILFASGSRLVFLLLFGLLPQSLNFFGEFVPIGSSECLDDIQQFLHRLFRLDGQRPRPSQQRFYLLQNGFDIHPAHQIILRNPANEELLAMGEYARTSKVTPIWRNPPICHKPFVPGRCLCSIRTTGVTDESQWPRVRRAGIVAAQVSSWRSRGLGTANSSK